uniref:NADH-ubiquinone oxidoreductase chain 6 n=1 Tax=Limbodessus palmulaoides TaxID=985783 RepID=A0A343W9X3_9DYTI|nr:NADH dehydrogenase subunit 6 [Limbodessus palmulaoides]AVZ66438.1 NADH dehydrogenase subunit 6 [Limbodessus palmulaoides]
MYFLILLNLMFSMIFLFMNHPLSMGINLLIQTIIISIIMIMFSLSSWFSYILFLIMVGGMLILFMYMTSLASNEKFKFSTKIFTISLIFMFIMMLMKIDPLFINMLSKTSNNMELLNNMNLLKNENLNSLNSMYNKPNHIITIMMINYLLITLIAVVKITKFNSGPLRQMF